MPHLIKKMISRSAGAKTTYDCIIGHSAAPHIATHLKSQLLSVGINLRHVYIGSNSALSGTTMGPGFLDTFFWPADEMEFQILTKTEESMQELLSSSSSTKTHHHHHQHTTPQPPPPKLPSIRSSKSERYTNRSGAFYPTRFSHKEPDFSHKESVVDSKTSEFAETIRESRFKRRAISMRVLNFRKNSGRVSPLSNAQPVRFGVGSAKSLRLLC